MKTYSTRSSDESGANKKDCGCGLGDKCPDPPQSWASQTVVYGDERDELLSLIRAEYPEVTGLPECPPEDMKKGAFEDDRRLQTEIDRALTSPDKNDLLEACKAMKEAFGDPMTRRALGGHNEFQQRAILAASAAIAAHEKPTDLEVRVREFLWDWRKGDFELPSLAARDAEAMERALKSQEKRKRQ